MADVASVTLALYQPDMPQNCGAVMRLAACMGVPLDLIEPFGFVWDDARIRRVAMDYIHHVALTRHQSWESFKAVKESNNQRIILATTKGAIPYTNFAFQAGDVLLMGRESAGVPDDVHSAAAARIVIPLQNGMRSLNVGMSAAIMLGEALRQTGRNDGTIAIRKAL